MHRPFVILAALLAASAAHAGGERVPPVDDTLTRQECGECHMAFQPAFLPARSWERLMRELPRHFGEDAALPPAKADAIGAYLAANAGDRQGGGLARKFLRWVAPGGTPQRITENPAFQREHRFPAAVWQRPEVAVRSNCPACHQAAEQGSYED